jgi:hypothetical protein
MTHQNPNLFDPSVLVAPSATTSLMASKFSMISEAGLPVL